MLVDAARWRRRAPFSADDRPEVRGRVGRQAQHDRRVVEAGGRLDGRARAQLLRRVRTRRSPSSEPTSSSGRSRPSRSARSTSRRRPWAAARRARRRTRRAAAPRPAPNRPRASGAAVREPHEPPALGSRMVSSTGAGFWHLLQVSASIQVPASARSNPGKTAPVARSFAVAEIGGAAARQLHVPQRGRDQLDVEDARLQIGDGHPGVEADRDAVDLLERDVAPLPVARDVAPVEDPGPRRAAPPASSATRGRPRSRASRSPSARRSCVFVDVAVGFRKIMLRAPCPGVVPFANSSRYV